MWKKRVFFTEKSATISVYLAVKYSGKKLKADNNRKKSYNLKSSIG